jgi:Alpha amylase, catalytic domain
MNSKVSFLAATGMFAVLAGCSSAPETAELQENAVSTPGYNDINLAAGSMVLYEAQVRTANACHPDVGSAAQKAACAVKVAPKVAYRAQGMQCGMVTDLQKIKLGTLDDMLENTADHKQGITLRYVKERVGANTLWLMPLFPNNDQWSIPDACDNLGSPYAVRDYMHAAGTLSRACIADSRDEYSTKPCWANNEMDKLIGDAHGKGMRVMLDVALNHFGHNYLMYDYAEFVSENDRLGAGGDLHSAWDFAKTYEENLLRPVLLDSPEQLTELAKAEPHKSMLANLTKKCPALAGDELVRSYNSWRIALPHERDQFPCAKSLEFQVPGFFLGANAKDPSTRLGDNFTNNWRDVKFLFHHEENTAHQWEFVRDREYLFRVLNYWVSRGVDGFRFDHTTDPDGGMGSNEWQYLVSKVNYYANRRGQKTPVYLAEEFHEQMEMNKVVDVMTEGYVGDMTGRGGRTKNASSVERVLGSMFRFNDRAFVMTALETHDEKRLTDDTGFNVWTGAGFWGIGAATRSTPMILMGQEFGETYGLGFKRSDFLRSRFEGTGQFNPSGDALVSYYNRMIGQRLDGANRALLAPTQWNLRTKNGHVVDERILALAKWTTDGNVMFVFHNLFEQDVQQSYFIPPALAAIANIQDGLSYKLVDALSGTQQGGCKSGSDLKWELFVSMSAGTRAQWLRLERCQ